MPGVIFTQSKLDAGDRRINVREDTRDCAKVLEITSPNAHLKTRAHWVLGWIPPLEPKPHSNPKLDGEFKGRLFYAYRVWKDNGTRYWGYVEFDGKKCFGWIDPQNYKVTSKKLQKKSAEAVQKMYSAYRSQTLKRMKKAWRYRVPIKLPSSAHDRDAPSVADPERETRLTSRDQTWDSLDATNKVPVRMCLRIPTSALVPLKPSEEEAYQMKLAEHQRKLAEDRLRGVERQRKEPQKPSPKYYLQAFQNPWTNTRCPLYLRWMDYTDPLKEKIKELDKEIKSLKKENPRKAAALAEKKEHEDRLAEYGDRPRKNAVMKDGKPVKAEQFLAPQRVQGDTAEFELSVRWAGVIGGKRWLLGKFFTGASGWTFIPCQSFSAPKLEVNPSVQSNEELKAPPAGSKSWDLYKKATDPKNKKRRAAFNDLKNDPYKKYWRYRHYCRRRVQVMIGKLLAAHGAP
jgi:hypothetical protein